MSKLDFTVVEEASRALKLVVNAKNPNATLEATCASGNKDSYYQFIVLTQRIKRNGEIIGYVCYRIRRPKKTNEVVFSSYEIFGREFDRATAIKYHLDPDPEAAFKNTAKEILQRCK